MGRRAKHPPQLVAPVASKKQLLDKPAVCVFLGGISPDTLEGLDGFPSPLQIVSGKKLWSVDQLERYVARQEKAVEALSA